MSIKKAHIYSVIAISTAITVGLLGLSSTAHAATKKTTITCYKGAASKSVTGSPAKCPAGFTTTKPVTTAPTTTPTTKSVSTTSAASTIAFTGTYKGSLSMLWSDSSVTVTSLAGTGTGSDIGDSKLTGTGGASPSSQCDSINGTGSIAGSAGSLTVKLDTDAQGCAEDGAAPTTVNVKGNAVITGGTGKYLGASGKLSMAGSFTIKSTSAGSSEKDDFKVTLTGTITLKK